jgi:hypothetical protein
MASRTVPVAVLICVIYLFGICSANDDIAKPYIWPVGGQWSYEDIMTSANLHTSDLILYPYSFTAEGVSFPNGAVIGLTSTYNLNYIADNTDIILTRAQALYDVNIAILDISITTQSGNKTTIDELTYEAYDYCTLFTNFVWGKYGTCWEGPSYLSWVTQNPGYGAQVVYVSETDIQGGILMIPNTNTPRFGLLIIPDIYQGAQDNITAMLGSTGQSQIVAFANNGGTIFTSGKGALILQEPSIGLVPAGTLDTANTLMAANYANSVTACTSAAPNTELDWVTSTLCLSPPQSNGITFDSVTSAPLALNPSNMNVLSYWNVTTGGLTTMTSAGAPTSVLSTTTTTYPQTLYKAVGEGQLIVHLGNPIWQSASYGWVFNALFAAMARPIILEGYVNSSLTNTTSAYIPAFEPVALDIVITLSNLFTDNLPNANFIIYVANGVEVLSAPQGCIVVNATHPVPNVLLAPDFHVDCTGFFSGGTVPAFYTNTFSVKIQIVDTSITAVMNNIVLLYPFLTYLEPSRDNLLVTLDNGPIVVDAADAASLTADQNADPMGIYPILGAGRPDQAHLHHRFRLPLLRQHCQRCDQLEIPFHQRRPGPRHLQGPGRL